MPVFLDELSDDAIADARRVCGNDSLCIYDFSQTGNEELAIVTMTTNEVNIMDSILLCELWFNIYCTIDRNVFFVDYYQNTTGNKSQKLQTIILLYFTNHKFLFNQHERTSKLLLE